MAPCSRPSNVLSPLGAVERSYVVLRWPGPDAVPEALGTVSARRRAVARSVPRHTWPRIPGTELRVRSAGAVSKALLLRALDRDLRVGHSTDSCHDANGPSGLHPTRDLRPATRMSWCEGLRTVSALWPRGALRTRRCGHLRLPT